MKANFVAFLPMTPTRRQARPAMRPRNPELEKLVAAVHNSERFEAEAVASRVSEALAKARAKSQEAT